MSEHKVKEAALEELIGTRRAKLLEEFDKDPANVLLRSEVIFGGIYVADGKYGIQCGSYPSGFLKQVCFDLLFRAMMMFQHIELAAAMKSQSEKRIITPDAK